MNYRKSLAVFVLLLATTRPAFASHALNGLAVLPYVITGLLLLLVIVVVNLVLSLANMKKKRAGMRVANVLLALPVLILGILLVADKAAFGYIMLFWTFVQGCIIYGSFATADEKDV